MCREQLSLQCGAVSLSLAGVGWAMLSVSFIVSTYYNMLSCLSVLQAWAGRCSPSPSSCPPTTTCCLVSLSCRRGLGDVLRLLHRVHLLQHAVLSLCLTGVGWAMLSVSFIVSIYYNMLSCLSVLQAWAGRCSPSPSSCPSTTTCCLVSLSCRRGLGDVLRLIHRVQLLQHAVLSLCLAGVGWAMFSVSFIVSTYYNMLSCLSVLQAWAGRCSPSPSSCPSTTTCSSPGASSTCSRHSPKTCLGGTAATRGTLPVGGAHVVSDNDGTSRKRDL